MILYFGFLVDQNFLDMFLPFSLKKITWYDLEITFQFPYAHLPKKYKPYEIKIIFLMGLVQHKFGSHSQIFSNLLHFLKSWIYY